MTNVYLSLADGFEKLAAGYRTLANGKADAAAAPNPAPVAEETTTLNEKQYSIEDVRAVLGEINKAGKAAEVRALLMKYDSGKLSEVKPDDYPALVREAEAL